MCRKNRPRCKKPRRFTIKRLIPHHLRLPQLAWRQVSLSFSATPLPVTNTGRNSWTQHNQGQNYSCRGGDSLSETLNSSGTSVATDLYTKYMGHHASLIKTGQFEFSGYSLGMWNSRYSMTWKTGGTAEPGDTSLWIKKDTYSSVTTLLQNIRKLWASFGWHQPMR